MNSVSLEDLINVGGLEVANVTIYGTNGQIEKTLAEVEASSFNAIKLSDLLQGKKVSITYKNGEEYITYALEVAPADPADQE